MSAPMLATPRLILRQWDKVDLPDFARINADPQVMRYFPAVLDRAQSDALAEGIRTRLRDTRFGLWALELPGKLRFAGFVGLSVPAYTTHFTPCVEIGWRLARCCWGQGYATEAASRVLDYAFDALALVEVVSFTARQNLPSRAVMRRLGMQHDVAGDFPHPLLATGHPLSHHVLYRLPRQTWLARRACVPSDSRATHTPGA